MLYEKWMWNCVVRLRDIECNMDISFKCVYGLMKLAKWRMD